MTDNPDNAPVRTKVVGHRERRYPGEPKSRREMLELVDPVRLRPPQADPDTIPALVEAVALLPCPVPWCGGSPRMGNGYPDMRERFIICEKCGLKTPHSKPFDVAGVSALWNTHAAMPSGDSDG